jgi:5'-nucleotidase
MSRKLALTLLFALGVCAAPWTACAAPRAAGEAAAPVEVKIIGFNDFHGNLEPPQLAISARVPGLAEPVRVPAGGAAYLASAVRRLRTGNPNNVTVSAGDMIGGSPLVSSFFLDEPTVLAMNAIGVDFDAVGNHEFDRGREELLRMQRGGCAKHTARTPCRLDRFPGARFRILAANVRTETGQTLFPAYGIRRFGAGVRQVRVAFIGLTLRETPTLVTPSGVKGLDFGDEAEAINRLVPQLRREGADAIVVLIHQGVSQPDPPFASKADEAPPVPSCASVDGELLPILAKLDPAVDLVVSGHTHNAYICDYSKVDPSRRFLVTSAGKYGTLLTDIDLAVVPRRGVVERRARNLIVQGEGFRAGADSVPVSALFPVFPSDPGIAALVNRYAAAAAPLAERPVGHLLATASRDKSPAGETAAGDLIADAQLAATSPAAAGGAQIAFMNGTGVRADIVPLADGTLTYGAIYAAQPFANSLVVKTFTGAQVRRLLEQQFASGRNTVEKPNMLMASRGFAYRFDLTRPEGQRILDLTLNGAPVRVEARYRVTMNSFLAAGGDNFTVFREGTDVLGGPQDIDALERYVAGAGELKPPVPDRITRIDAKAAKP